MSKPNVASCLLPAVLLLALASCSPTEGPETSSVNLGGETTDSFSITVTRQSDGLAVRDLTIKARWVDEDHIDQETGQHVVRRERQGLTDSYGFWTKTVTYDGAGEYACDKVIFEVWWVESRLYYGDARLDKNAASATVSVRMP